MNSLHLFAGIGGGILADKILGHTIVGAVEIEPYCRAVLKQRQDEGYLEKFPIFDDIRTFNGNEIRERIDLVCGGFPCQDISTAGRGAGIDGKKSSLFYELIRVCRTVKPRYIFLENSPAITGRGLGVCLNEIAKIGYDAEWTDLSAGICGAPHLRNRWWCICKMSDADCERELQPERIVEKIRRRFGDLGREDFETVQRGSVKTWAEEERSRRDTETDREREICDAQSLGRGQGVFDGNVDEQTKERESRPCGTSNGYGNGGRVAAQRTQEGARNDSLSGSAGYPSDAESERLRRPSDRAADEQNGTELADSCSDDGESEERKRLSGDQEERTTGQVSDRYAMGRRSFDGAGGDRDADGTRLAESVGDGHCNGTREIADSESLGRGSLCRSGGNKTRLETQFSELSRGSGRNGTREIPDARAMGREQGGGELRQSTEPSFSWIVSGSADGWWETEPPLGRVVNGLPHRVDALKGLGNAQVPVVAALAFLMLMERFCEE